MKKNLTIILAIALSFGVFAQQNTWPSALGNVSFATDSTWTISGNGIFQIWSDAVQTDYCSNKTEFSGWYRNIGLNIDCRSNPGFPGDLFSGQAVFDLRNELCPYPWRVPFRNDFIRLDIALGGDGSVRTRFHILPDTLRMVTDRYLNDWGGTLGGFVNSSGYLGNQGRYAYYWSFTANGPNEAFFLFLGMNGVVIPRDFHSRSYGFSLRCVRDN